jgi:CheY-like chemotaxis protein
MDATQGGNALIADDDPAIRDFLGTLLRLEGHFIQISVAANRDVALELALSHKPRLILMDYKMPGIEAVEFVARVRKDLPQSRIVLMTSAHFANDKATELGLTDFLSKPFDVPVLREMVRACARNNVVPAA